MLTISRSIGEGEVAFQNYPAFSGMLQRLAESTILGECAPAENVLLDERVSKDRETDYFICSNFSPLPETSASDWFEKHKAYSSKRLRYVPICATFDVGNETAHLRLNHEMDVVRIETLSSLCERGSVRFAEPVELFQTVQDLLDRRQRHESPDNATVDFLESWLNRLNGASDGRPMYVAPFAEVERHLIQPDWPNRLRDALGLGHIRPIGSNPAKVILFRYSLERPYLEHRALPAWAATPTVLDDPGTSGLSTCFFPAPKKSTPPEFGFTVDLSGAGGTTCEFLHAHIDYTLADVFSIGQVTKEITDGEIASARQNHLERFRPQFQFHTDLPART